MTAKYKYLLLALALLAGSMYWVIYGGDLFTLQDVARQMPNAILKDTSFSEDKDGKRSWELTARQVEIDAARNINILTGVTGRLYRTDGTAVDVKSAGGVYNTDSREVRLTGDVFALYSGGGTLTCDEISWLPSGDSITATGRVRIKNERFAASGDKIETDRDIIKIKITGNGMVERGG